MIDFAVFPFNLSLADYPPALLALCSSFFFATASFIYRRYAIRKGVLWMNSFKATVAFFLFSLALILRGVPWAFPDLISCFLLALSGLIGLNLGDFLLLHSYKKIGSGRSLMITAFNPLVLSVVGFLVFDERLKTEHVVAVIFMSFCVLSIGLEDFRKSKSFDFSGISYAMGAASLDATGILITRAVFRSYPMLDPQLANWIRITGALAGFVVIHFSGRKIGLISGFLSMPIKDRGLAVFSSFLGTFFALTLWITALKYGPIGLVAAMGGFGPLYATSIECYSQRVWPSRYLLAAALSFAIGFTFIIKTL